MWSVEGIKRNYTTKKHYKLKKLVLFFYTHQTSDMCADICMCNYTHQMEEIENLP